MVRDRNGRRGAAGSLLHDDVTATPVERLRIPGLRESGTPLSGSLSRPDRTVVARLSPVSRRADAARRRPGRRRASPRDSGFVMTAHRSTSPVPPSPRLAPVSGGVCALHPPHRRGRPSHTPPSAPPTHPWSPAGPRHLPTACLRRSNPHRRISLRFRPTRFLSTVAAVVSGPHPRAVAPRRHTKNALRLRHTGKNALRPTPAVCRIPCLTLCLADVERTSMARRTVPDRANGPFLWRIWGTKTASSTLRNTSYSQPLRRTRASHHRACSDRLKLFKNGLQ